jgi:hypothetical protein
MRKRIEKPQPLLVISVRGRIVFAREDRSTTLSIMSKQQEEREYQKRHDEFMAFGGKKELLNYSNNIAKQIKQFKESR